MKNIYNYLFCVFFSTFTFAQIGINTKTPKATLDVNGNVVIQKVETAASDDQILSINSAGIVTKRSAKDVVDNKFTLTKSINSGEAVIYKNTLNFEAAIIIIKAVNGCTREMISSFVSSNQAITFLGGIARDKIGTATILPIESGKSVYAPSISIIFEDTLLPCQDGGDKTQFNFTLKKLSNTDYELTNNGNIAKNFTITWMKL